MDRKQLIKFLWLKRKARKKLGWQAAKLGLIGQIIGKAV